MAGNWSLSDDSDQLWVLVYAVPMIQSQSSFAGLRNLCWKSIQAYTQPGEGALASRPEAMITRSICGSLILSTSLTLVSELEARGIKAKSRNMDSRARPPAWLCHFLSWLDWGRSYCVLEPLFFPCSEMGTMMSTCIRQILTRGSSE